MTCVEATRLIGPWVDDELDVRSAVDLEGHVARCATCARDREELLALRETARKRLPRYELDPGTEARLLRSVRAVQQPRRVRRQWVREVALMAAAACVAVGVTWSIRRPGDDAADAIADAHVRSLQGDHLTDVASSDQHTVKPWFQGKLDFSVPTRDYAAEGFPLVGGRLDVLGGRPVAALAYRRRQHVLNLFVWPADGGEKEPHTSSSRGYRVTSWARGGFEYRLVSDVAAADSSELVALLRSPEP